MKVRVGHVSMQFGDTNPQHTQDVNTVFNFAKKRNWAWITGTEAGPGSGNLPKELIRIGEASGYRLWVPSVQAGNSKGQFSDVWIAVRKSFIDGKYKAGYKNSIPGSANMPKTVDTEGKRWGPKGIVNVQFVNDTYGEFHIGAAHYLTEARQPSSQFWEWNQKLADDIDAWANKRAEGDAMAFYGGDQNMVDSKNNAPQGDTFMGGKFVSIADATDTYFNTGHGPIDVIASLKTNKRATPVRWNVYDDRELFLHGDHFACEAVYDLEPLDS